MLGSDLVLFYALHRRYSPRAGARHGREYSGEVTLISKSACERNPPATAPDASTGPLRVLRGTSEAIDGAERRSIGGTPEQTV